MNERVEPTLAVSTVMVVAARKALFLVRGQLVRSRSPQATRMLPSKSATKLIRHNIAVKSFACFNIGEKLCILFVVKFAFYCFACLNVYSCDDWSCHLCLPYAIDTECACDGCACVACYLETIVSGAHVVVSTNRTACKV